jgi:hypothetical protein
VLPVAATDTVGQGLLQTTPSGLPNYCVVAGCTTYRHDLYASTGIGCKHVPHRMLNAVLGTHAVCKVTTIIMTLKVNNRHTL